MNEKTNMSVTDNVDVKIESSEAITDLIFNKLYRLEHLVEGMFADINQERIVVTTATDHDVKKAVHDAVMKYHHLFSSKLADSAINDIATDVLNTLKQK